jgi:hypothetical protein
MRNPAIPLRQQSIADDSLVSSDCRMCLGVEGFRAVAELLFRVVVRQVSKRYTSTEVHLLDMDMLSFDFGPCTALGGEVFDKANRNFLLDSPAVRLSNCSEDMM